MMRFGPDRPRRRPSLTPMIDVVFLLLVFFMLASRFGTDQHLTLSLAGQGGGAYAGPPRLVDIDVQGVRLNGAPVAPQDLAMSLERLMETPGDTIILRSGTGVDLQRVIAVMDRLQAAGFSQLVLLE